MLKSNVWSHVWLQFLNEFLVLMKFKRWIYGAWKKRILKVLAIVQFILIDLDTLISRLLAKTLTNRRLHNVLRTLLLIWILLFILLQKQQRGLIEQRALSIFRGYLLLFNIVLHFQIHHYLHAALDIFHEVARRQVLILQGFNFWKLFHLIILNFSDLYIQKHKNGPILKNYLLHRAIWSWPWDTAKSNHRSPMCSCYNWTVSSDFAENSNFYVLWCLPLFSAIFKKQI